jgi:hypothetical protein
VCCGFYVQNSVCQCVCNSCTKSVDRIVELLSLCGNTTDRPRPTNKRKGKRAPITARCDEARPTIGIGSGRRPLLLLLLKAKTNGSAAKKKKKRKRKRIDAIHSSCSRHLPFLFVSACPLSTYLHTKSSWENQSVPTISILLVPLPSLKRQWQLHGRRRAWLGAEVSMLQGLPSREAGARVEP